MEIKEDLLHHIWKYQLFRVPLLDLDDKPVELVNPGQHNRDSGPDFFSAMIKSDDILWAGNVEIHNKASEWYQHGHHLDKAYDNVILHVVLSPDCQVENSSGRKIRTVKLEIEPAIRLRYELLMENPGSIPCRKALTLVNRERMNMWMERLLIERFEEKTSSIETELRRCAGDWKEVIFRSMARAFGQHINADPFEMLSRSVSLKMILDKCSDLVSKEAILFGQAGMLTAEFHDDDYYSELVRRYQTMNKEHGLQSIDGFLWKFLRLRPDNFPTIRISQLACSLERYPDFFTQLLELHDPVDSLMQMDIRASEYWETHYRFHFRSPPRPKSMGKDRLHGLLVNAVLPVLFARSCFLEKSFHAPDIPEILRSFPPEDNRIIRMWKSLGIDVPDLFSSQALLQLTI